MKYSHSATGLVFPGTSNAPPMHTTRPIRSLTVVASRRTISARFVRGPIAMYVMLLAGWDRISSSDTSAPGLSVRIS
jgi:hypothetical protein